MSVHANFRLEAWAKNTVIWSGRVQPTVLSAEYAVLVVYESPSAPTAEVLDPLTLAQGTTKLPHTYGGQSLCLYLPRTGEWNSRLLIARTIVPWISLWLMYYEVWLATGEWLGGGVHPEGVKISERD